MTPVIFLPEARAEAVDSFRWYEERRAGLGAVFRNELDAAIIRIAEAPQTFAVYYKDLRRVLVRRFPYAVYYRTYPDLVVIVGVFHGKRDPNALRRRAGRPSGR